MTPHHWNDPPAQRWSTETLRREVARDRQERRERFALWATMAGGFLVLALLAVIERVS